MSNSMDSRQESEMRDSDAITQLNTAADFTPRILPHHVLALPTEIRRMIWQK